MLNYRRTDLLRPLATTLNQEEQMEDELTCKDDPNIINHASPNTWEEYDARGIYLARVCEHCVKQKLSKYRPDVLTDPNYATCEPIDEDW